MVFCRTCMTGLGVVWACLGLISRGQGQTLVHWTFNETLEAASQSASAWHSAAPVHYHEDVPGAWIYDPLSGNSRRNEASLDLTDAQPDQKPLEASVALDGLQRGGSFTLECFVKAAAEAGGDTWLVGKSRSGGDAAELAAAWVRLPSANQTWHGTIFAEPGERTQNFEVGHYATTTRLHGKHLRWRHVAISYDADTQAVTCWVDYHLTKTVPLQKPLTWDQSPLTLGGRPGKLAMRALVDEVRLTQGVLSPPQFLRARADAIQDVSFVSNQTIVPPDAGCYDIKEHFGAAGDGKTDDTAAFNAAFEHLASKVPLAYNTLIVPPGEYLITGTIQGSRFIDVRGAGPDATVLRLKDGTFTDPENPQPVLRMSSTHGAPGSNRGTNGSSISIYVEDLKISTGRGNPGAKALEYHSNNIGRLENVVLESGDGAGVIGLDLTHHDVGPALVKNVEVEGFDYGAAIRYQEYSMTLERVTLRGQNVAGIRNQGNILAIRRLVSQNRVPAIVAEGANSMVTLIDSRLEGGAADQAAIESEGALYCLRVTTQGYGNAIAKRILKNLKPPEWEMATVAGPDLQEYIGDQTVTGHGSPNGALKLPIEETPEFPLPPVEQWVNVLDFVDPAHGTDTSPAFQAAIDSGAEVLYFPANQRMTFHAPVRLHGKVKRIVGFGHGLNWSSDVYQKEGRREQTQQAGAAPPLLIFDEPDASRTVILDRLACVHVQHASPATLVLRSSSPDRYTTARAGGRLFAEDVGGADWHFDHPQQVWVRQWNPESHAAGPCIHSQGATIWALGFKTEYESQKLLAENGAKTEILGSFIYPLGKIPAERPIFENRNSQISLVYGTSVYNSNHKVHIRDAQADDVLEIGNDRLKWAGSRARMNLYSSDAR